MCGAEGRWQLKDKHFFNQRGAHLTALDYHKPTNMLVVAYSSGVFDLYQVMLAERLSLCTARLWCKCPGLDTQMACWATLHQMWSPAHVVPSLWPSARRRLSHPVAAVCAAAGV